MLKTIAVVAIFLALYYGYKDTLKKPGNETEDIMTSFALSQSLLDVTVAMEKEEKMTLTMSKSKMEIATINVGVDMEFDVGSISEFENHQGMQYANKDYVLEVSLSELDKKLVCTNILWRAKKPDRPIHDCINIKGANWYGGAEVFSQRWPIQLNPQTMSTYLSWDIFSRRDDYGSVMERYFLASSGMVLYIDHDSPLHIGYDDEKLCVKSDYDHIKYPYYTGKRLELKYTLCIAEDILQVHKALLGKLWKFPSEVPDHRIFESPIWSTWAQYKMDVTLGDVVTFTDKIVSNGFPASHIEIDDKYTTNYGDWEWDEHKFPHPKNLSDYIHRHGFRVTSWMMPFVEADAKAFYEGMTKGYFVRDASNLVPGLVKWWQGIGAVIDFTNRAAMKWFEQRLIYLRKSGVDSFKFDAGENQYLPPIFNTHQQLKNPMEFVKHYVTALREISDNSIEVRVGYQTQNIGIFVRMMDKSSVWGYDNGLKTLIPSALHFGIIGYPFILPDMIGGNAYSEDNDVYGNIPDRELFIRWLEVTAFFPSMQFSIAPWQYDDQTTLIALKYVKIHQEFVTPRVIKLAEEATQNGYPIIRPLWWIAPDDPMTFDLDSEFLIGDDLLVAPVLEQNVRKRNIYLPKGTWQDLRDEKNVKIVQGPLTIKDYPIELDEIGLFQRI